MNCLLRNVYNRPDTLTLSIEYEKIAREYYGKEIKTLFFVEYGSPSEVIDIINKYPYEKEIILRDDFFPDWRISFSILDGICEAFNRSDDRIYHIEDDILISKDFFVVVDKIIKDNKNISTSNGMYLKNYHGDDANIVFLSPHFKSCGYCMTKVFYETYLSERIQQYKEDPINTICSLDDKNRNIYAKYGVQERWIEQDGLIIRTCIDAFYNNDFICAFPYANRSMHIGINGKNCRGFVPGQNLNDKINKLRDIIKNNSFDNYLIIKEYGDSFFGFKDSIDNWNGDLEYKLLYE